MAASMFKIAPFRIGAARSVGGAAAGGGEDGRGEGGGDVASAVRIPPPPVSFFGLLKKSMIVNKILHSMLLQLYVRSKRIVCHSFEKVQRSFPNTCIGVSFFEAYRRFMSVRMMKP